MVAFVLVGLILTAIVGGILYIPVNVIWQVMAGPVTSDSVVALLVISYLMAGGIVVCGLVKYQRWLDGRPRTPSGPSED